MTDVKVNGVEVPAKKGKIGYAPGTSLIRDHVWPTEKEKPAVEAILPLLEGYSTTEVKNILKAVKQIIIQTAPITVLIQEEADLKA